MRVALTGLTLVRRHEMAKSHRNIDVASDVAQLLDRLAAETAFNRDAIDRQLAECDEHLHARG